jgi:hypothetical protein
LPGGRICDFCYGGSLINHFSKTNWPIHFYLRLMSISNRTKIVNLFSFGWTSMVEIQNPSELMATVHVCLFRLHIFYVCTSFALNGSTRCGTTS